MSAPSIPPAFRKRFAEHNQQAILASFLAATLACFCWLLAYGFVYWLALFIGTIKNGVQAVAPHWITPLFFAVAGLLFILAALDYAASPYRPPDDRPIFGLHLFKDLLLALPRLTFAVFGNLMAYRRLSDDDLQRAWLLLQRIHDERKSDAFTLSQVEPDSRRLNALLLALQITDFIDLHRGEENWFYTVRSDQLEAIAGMMKIEDGESPEN